MHSKHNTPEVNYKEAGVDIDAGNALVDRIKPLAKSTARSGVMGSIGGFGGLFDLEACGYTDPILVAGTDGVGTKLRVALEAGIHNTVGIDLVAMCVNDLIVQGAQPLFFLDYFATGSLDVDVAEAVIAGIAEGCNQAQCALLGGETAEMPGMYADSDYDLAGFAVGAVERDAILPRDDIEEGDVVLGITSSGIHSNGFSLVRYVIEQKMLSYSHAAPWNEAQSLGEALLTPTIIYTDICRAMIQAGGVKAFSHITGGGLTENLPRILPDALAIDIDLDSWTMDPVFDWLYSSGNISAEEMLKTFNCGIGMCAIVSEKEKESMLNICRETRHSIMKIGRVTNRENSNAVTYKGML